MSVDRNRSSRFFGAFKRIVEELFPALSFHLGNYRYRVQSISGNFVSCQPVRSDLGLPDLKRLPFRGAPGSFGVLQVGTVVVVSFVDGDGSGTDSRIAYIAAVEGPDGAGFLPTTLRLDASAEVDVGLSAQLVKLAGAGGKVLRDGEKIAITITGAVVAGGGTSGTVTGTGIIVVDASTELAPGPPGTGFSRVLA